MIRISTQASHVALACAHLEIHQSLLATAARRRAATPRDRPRKEIHRFLPRRHSSLATLPLNGSRTMENTNHSNKGRKTARYVTLITSQNEVAKSPPFLFLRAFRPFDAAASASMRQFISIPISSTERINSHWARALGGILASVCQQAARATNSACVRCGGAAICTGAEGRSS